MTFEVSCGNHRQLIHTESCALNLATILVVLHSQTVSLPSASPDTTRLVEESVGERGGGGRGGRGEGGGGKVDERVTYVAVEKLNDRNSTVLW